MSFTRPCTSLGSGAGLKAPFFRSLKSFNDEEHIFRGLWPRLLCRMEAMVLASRMSEQNDTTGARPFPIMPMFNLAENVLNTLRFNSLASTSHALQSITILGAEREASGVRGTTDSTWTVGPEVNTWIVVTSSLESPPCIPHWLLLKTWPWYVCCPFVGYTNGQSNYKSPAWTEYAKNAFTLNLLAVLLKCMCTNMMKGL